MIYHVDYNSVRPYITKDGSIIRELVHPAAGIEGVTQSLAEATVLPGSRTTMHCHRKSQEIYHITDGCGIMQLGSQAIEVKEGDTIYIPPKTPHSIENTGAESLKILCCCAPPYSHEDTELLPDDAKRACKE